MSSDVFVQLVDIKVKIKFFICLQVTQFIFEKQFEYSDVYAFEDLQFLKAVVSSFSSELFANVQHQVVSDL